VTGQGSYLAPASGHRVPNATSAHDFGAHEFVDLENDALKDVGGVDLVFDVIGGDVQKRSAALIKAGGTLVSIVGPVEARPTEGQNLSVASIYRALAEHAKREASSQV
jgi:NADPH:quinone reductase-like Zn-dependent oxidoreductase